MIIGLCGYAQTGKDTSGIHLVDLYRFKRYAFADPLKEAAKILGWNGEKDEKGRRFLQLLGTEAIKSVFGDDFWALLTFQKIQEAKTKNVVITDVRFPIEAKVIREHGGLIWRVHRTNYGPLNNHSSETEVDNIIPDEELFNSGTIEELYAQIDAKLPLPRCKRGHKAKYPNGRCIPCSREYYKQNRERLLEYQKGYNKVHEEDIREYSKQYYEKLAKDRRNG